MKKYILPLLLLISLSCVAGDNDSWFVRRPKPIRRFAPPPSEPVPLDGGIALLLAAGGAAAYKKYKKEDV